MPPVAIRRGARSFADKPFNLSLSDAVAGPCPAEEHPAVAEELSGCEFSLDEVFQALPLATQACIFLGLALEVYATRHGGPAATD